MGIGDVYRGDVNGSTATHPLPGKDQPPMRPRPPQWILPLSILFALCNAVLPAAAEEKATPGKQPQTDVMSKVLADVSFQDVAFDDVIDFLRDSAGFQAVVVRDPGVPEGQPIIRLRLKAVPLGQLLQVLVAAHPEITMQAVDSPDAPAIHVIRIVATDATGPAAAEKAGSKAVQVYPLRAEIISVLRSRGVPMAQGGPEKEEMKKALEQVLSLIKGVVEATGDKAPPTLAVHEETQSLIVTGTAEQQARVQETLAALRGERPQENQQAALTQAERQWRQHKADYEEQIDKLRHEAQRLKDELAVARVEAREAEDLSRKQAIEAERARVRLEEALTRGSGGKSPSPTTPGDGAGSAPGAK